MFPAINFNHCFFLCRRNICFGASCITALSICDIVVFAGLFLKFQTFCDNEKFLACKKSKKSDKIVTWSSNYDVITRLGAVMHNTLLPLHC